MAGHNKIIPRDALHGPSDKVRMWVDIPSQTDDDTVDSPQIGHPPGPDKPLLRSCSVSGKEFGYMTARPSPQ
jgi:hypothetical protein